MATESDLHSDAIRLLKEQDWFRGFRAMVTLTAPPDNITDLQMAWLAYGFMARLAASAAITQASPPQQRELALCGKAIFHHLRDASPGLEVMREWLDRRIEMGTASDMRRAIRNAVSAAASASVLRSKEVTKNNVWYARETLRMTMHTELTREEREYLAPLVRSCLGNPWQPRPTRKYSPQIVALASGVYQSCEPLQPLDPVRLAILADAVDEEGHDEEICQALRGWYPCLSCSSFQVVYCEETDTYSKEKSDCAICRDTPRRQWPVYPGFWPVEEILRSEAPSAPSQEEQR